MGRRLRERPGVGELATKIKTADEGETLSEGYAAVAEAEGQREGGAIAKNQLGADTAYVGRRKKEDAMDGAWRRLGQSGDAERVGDGWKRSLGIVLRQFFGPQLGRLYFQGRTADFPEFPRHRRMIAYGGAACRRVPIVCQSGRSGHPSVLLKGGLTLA